MVVFGDGFTYNGISSENYGVVLCTFDSNEEGEFGLSRELITDAPTTGRLRNIHYGTKYNDVLTFDITLIKSPKGKENYFNYDDVRELNTWLTGNSYPKKLYIEGNEELENIYFNCVFTDVKTVKAQGHVVGLTYTATCDSSYGWEDFKRTITVDLTKDSDKTSVTVYNDSDETNKYLPVKISIAATCKSGWVENVFIKNTSDDADPYNNCGICISRNETVVMDGEHMTITSDKADRKYTLNSELEGLQLNGYGAIVDYFSYTWLKLVPGKNVLNIQGNCILTISGSYPRKVGVM